MHRGNEVNEKVKKKNIKIGTKEELYKDFFQGRNLVLSGNSIITWGSDISHGISTLRVKQKIPIKIYCGVNFNKSGNISFGKMKYYNSEEGSLKDDSLSLFTESRSKNIIEFLENFLRKHNYIDGIDIDFMSEIPSGHGFASSSTISVLLSFLVYIVVGKIDPKTILNKALKHDIELEEEIYNFSLELSNCISEGRSIGASNFAVMSDGIGLPIVHFSKQCNHIDRYGGNIMNEKNTAIHVPIHNTIYKDSLINFFGITDKGSQELPIDFGILFAGLPYRFSDIIDTRKQERNKKQETLEKIKKNIFSIKNIKEMDSDALIEFFQNYENDSISRESDEINIKILDGFRKLLDTGNIENSTDEFIETIQKAGHTSFGFQKQNKLLAALQYLFYEYREFEDEEIAIMPFNSGKTGGSLLFVLKKGKSQKTVQKVLSKLKKDGLIIGIDYASWINGYTGNSISIDQFISEKIFSEYTRSGNIFFSDTFGMSYSGEYESIIKNENDCILLDTISGRIYINGIKLTSKEIHSQNTTIDMFKLLLEDIGKEVSNEKLPISTYSQNKNEILGKVILPIKKLAKKHFGNELSLTCSGGISEYYIKLEKNTTIRIGIIKRLFS